jgi:hypothetical protein
MKNGSEYDVSPPDDLVRLTQGGIPGDGPDLETAIRRAWDRGKSADHKSFRVQEIYVFGENPISGYRVIIGPTI